MPTKDELAEQIGNLTGQEIVPENHSKADLEAMHEKALARVTVGEEPPGGSGARLGSLPVAVDDDGNPVEGSADLQPTRRKINRGSTRRINRAVENVEAALDEFAREIDGQVFLADADGNREAEHPLVTDVKNMKDFIRDAVQTFT